MNYNTLTGLVVANLEIDSSDLTRFKVLESLNSAQLTLLNILPSEHLINAVATARLNLVENQVAYQWPNDLVRIITVWVDFENPISNTNRGREATKWEQERHFSTMDTIATSRFPFYDPHIEGGFEIRPAPSSSVTNGGRLRYIWRVPDIATDQASLLEPKLQNLLVFRATSLSALVEGYNQKLSGDYNRLYTEELQRFIPKEETK